MKFTPVLTLASICLSAAIATPLSRFEAKVAKGLRFIQTSADTEPFWVSEGHKHDLLRTNKGLLDLTDTYHEIEEQTGQQVMSGVERVTYPPPSQETTVKSIISTLSIPRMEATLSNLTSFNNRYYQSDTGVAASTWIYNQLVSITGSRTDIVISQITHAWAQKSIVAKFNGASATAPVVILGSHLDSINLESPMSGRAPGADDDGTGTTNLIEVFRALVAANFTPARSVEFHFYAAEEVGLLGSKDIAANYKNDRVPVYAMANFDMTAYFKSGSKEVIALVTDRIDSGLNSYLESLISTYCSLPAGSDYCGYACSDHASWNKQGYPAAFAVEAPTEFENPKAHTPEDTTSVEGFSWSHTLEFAKLAVAVAVELGSV